MQAARTSCTRGSGRLSALPIGFLARLRHHENMTILLRILITAGALLLCAYLVPGIIVSSVLVAVVAAIVLGLLNLIARPILILLTLPITIVSLGLFIFVINAIVFALAASLVPGFAVAGFVPALIGSLIVSIVSTVANWVIE